MDMEDHEKMKSWALILLFSVVSVQCQTTPNPVLLQFMTNVKMTVNHLFTRADVNHNGHFDTQDLGNVFADYDANGDKLVSKTEFVTRFANNSDFLRPVALGMFFDLDMDKNGELDPVDARLYFNKIDQNDDGRVDHQEFVNYFTQLFEVLFILGLEAEEKSTTTMAP